jgi:hypothetical protein
MTYSPTDRLHRRFASSESLSTSPPGVRFLAGKWFPAPTSLYQMLLEDLDLYTVKFLPRHRESTADSVSCLEPHNLSCQGTVPFPEFGGPDESDFHSQSGQWLADRVIVAQGGYDNGKRQGISSTTEPAGTGQVGKQCKSKRHLVSRTNSGLCQEPTELAYFGGIEPHSGGLRGPCIKGADPTVQRGTPKPLKLLRS